MDQIEGGTLIINKGDEAKPKGNAEVDRDERNLNYVEGLAEGWKLAEVCPPTPCLRYIADLFLAGKCRRAHQELVPFSTSKGERRRSRKSCRPHHTLSHLPPHPTLPRSPPLLRRLSFAFGRLQPHRSFQRSLLPSPSSRSYEQSRPLELVAVNPGCMARHPVRGERVGRGCHGGRY